MRRTLRRFALTSLALSLLAWLPVLAETRIEKNLKLEPGGKLTIDSDVGAVDVTGKSGSGAHIVMTARDDDFESRFDVSMTELPGEVKVTVKKKKDFASWFSWIRSSNVRFEIQVPTRTRTAIDTGGGHVVVQDLEGDSSVDTSGGHIELTNLKGNVTADTSGGHITLKSISGNAQVDTSGGHIEVDGVSGSLVGDTSGGHITVGGVGGDIKVETSGGSIEISDAKGRVEADTSGGHVDVSFAKGNAKGGKIESSGGGITVMLDPDVNLTIDASCGGGRVTTDIPLKVVGRTGGSSLHGTLGNGGETLTVYTSGGGVKIASIGG
jgi:DUF4097 and DUF4098 domain-containing protein YvlB